MRTITKIIIHCTATPEGRKVSLDDVIRWHKARKFFTIGYHYLIHLDGAISRGRDEDVIGAHCYGHNSNSIGIAYVGGLDSDMNPKDTRTKEQKHALRMLIETLQDKYHNATIHTHNQFANKACPSFKIEDL